jgi:ligand-binding SRPBCC domain-containing protein
MKIHTLEQEQILPISLVEAWDFFSSPRNLDAITPPELGFRITHLPGETMYEGQIITYRIRLAPMLWIPWVTEIKAVREGHSFIDEQRSGPYRFWHHLHRFEAIPEGVKMRDLIHYALPFGPFGNIARACHVRAKLQRIFQYRREILAKRFPSPPG